MSSPDSLGPSGKFRWFTFNTPGVWDATTDLDIVTIGGSPCRSITILTDGTLVLMPASPITAGSAETSPALLNGTTVDVQATKLLKESTVTKVLIQW